MDDFLDPRPRRSHQFALWIVAATCLAAGLRLYQLDYGSFWLDELYTISASSKLGELHRSKAFGYVPTVLGLQFAGIDPASIPSESPAAWRGMGITEMVARLPTAILGIVSVPLIGIASVRLLGVRAAVLLTLLLAVSPWHIYWSQAARFYIPQFLFYSLSLIFYVVATRSQSNRHFLAAMVCFVLAFLSQPTALILLGVFGADWLAAHWRGYPLRITKAQWAMGTLAAAFCLSVLVRDIWFAPDNWTQFVDGHAQHQSPLRMLMGAAFLIGPPVATFAMLTAVGLRRTKPRLVAFLTIGAVGPVLLFAAMSAWAFIGLRYAFICLYAWLALAAIGLDQIHRLLSPRVPAAMAWSPVLILFAGLSVSDYMYFNSNGNYHARWRDAANYVLAHRQEGERVYASDPFTAQYYTGEPGVAALPGSIAEAKELDHVSWFIIDVTHSGKGSGRFWLLPHAELREVYPLKIVHASSSLQVYRLNPRSVD